MLSISAGARTVTHLAAYFDELRVASLRLVAGRGEEERDYLRPGEEERVRQVQGSYWHARGALLELIDDYRHDRNRLGDDYPQAFLVAFAAALLLVNAARFLRERFHDLSYVRHKLDEPAPELGIPAGMYAQVQKSLTSPRHAWHLYHALKYFDEHEAELRALADEQVELAPVLQVIDLLHPRLRVSIFDYAGTRLRVRGRRLGRHVGRDLVGRALYALQKLGCSLVADRYVRLGHRPGLPAPVRDDLAARLRPGDVLVVRKEHALTNYFLPGYWPHAALYLGTADELQQLGLRGEAEAASRWDQLAAGSEGEPRRVVEAMKDGVRIRSVDSPQASDSIVVLRPQLPADQQAAALARGLQHEGKPYDFDFDFNRSDRLVCTEVVYRAYDGVGGIELPLTSRAGRPTLSAGDLIEIALGGKHFRPIAAYVPTERREVAWNGEAEAVVRKVLEGEESSDER